MDKLAVAPGRCGSCTQDCNEIVARAGQGLQPQTGECYAGLTVVAVPVVAGHQHVATLLAGQVFRRPPTAKARALFARQLRAWGFNGNSSQARRAYRRTPVIPPARFRAQVRLLEMFAKQLGETAGNGHHARSADGPPCVCAAKEFAAANLGSRLTMRAVARHIHLSPHYFCRIFHEATGLTFTDFVARLRVEKAKGMLGNPFARVTEVVFDAGFQSISQFNAVFKKHAGQSPTEYRRSLQQQYTI